MSLTVVIYVVLLFFVLVAIHEWGHFYFAKRAGILVREFAIGFGPRIYSFRRGETTYTFRLLPIGGFVRMAGEEEERNLLSNGTLVRLTLDGSQVTRIEPLGGKDSDDQENSERKADSQSPEGLSAAGVLPGPEQGLIVADNQRLGTILHVDLDEKLQIRLQPLAEDPAYPVSETFEIHPQAMIGEPGTWHQIAPKNRMFNHKTIWQRFLTIFAGPMMNGVLAFFLFMLFVFLSGMPSDGPRIKIGETEPGTPAYEAGLRDGDEVLRIDGVSPGDDWNLLSEWIIAAADKPMKWEIDREGTALTMTVTPRMREYNGEQRVMAGVRPHRRTATIGEAVEGSGLMMAYFTENILYGFKKLFTGQVKMEELGGPVRTVNVTAQFAAKGPAAMMYWGGILSLYLGLFNLLPIPALDGSRIVFLMLEAVRGRPIPPNRESIVHVIGFAMMMVLMIVVTFNDIHMLFR